MRKHSEVDVSFPCALCDKMFQYEQGPPGKKVHLEEKVHLKLIHFSPLFGQILQIYLILDLF